MRKARAARSVGELESAQRFAEHLEASLGVDPAPSWVADAVDSDHVNAAPWGIVIVGAPVQRHDERHVVDTSPPKALGMAAFIRWPLLGTVRATLRARHGTPQPLPSRHVAEVVMRPSVGGGGRAGTRGTSGAVPSAPIFHR